ncbi:hypothetical protein EVAR_57233_1 [Eumeta japonica]|uniref:Uncharacterized protein n=1 Tax=Eumeta variegata TaxID=151549 RepID=A0A4C1ZKB4_EUMVA|nr:hypothetical protein EVAR_57233_1 [Eumeta japonica]
MESFNRRAAATTRDFGARADLSTSFISFLSPWGQRARRRRAKRSRGLWLAPHPARLVYEAMPISTVRKAQFTPAPAQHSYCRLKSLSVPPPPATKPAEFQESYS